LAPAKALGSKVPSFICFVLGSAAEASIARCVGLAFMVLIVSASSSPRVIKQTVWFWLFVAAFQSEAAFSQLDFLAAINMANAGVASPQYRSGGWPRC
jgi:hypothetical protein